MCRKDCEILTIVAVSVHHKIAVNSECVLRDEVMNIGNYSKWEICSLHHWPREKFDILFENFWRALSVKKSMRHSS